MPLHLPPYVPFPLLETDRLRLRAPRREDTEVFFEIGQARQKPIETPEQAEEYLVQLLQQYMAGENLTFFLDRKDGGGVAGSVGFYRGFEGGIGEIGYALVPPARGLGLAQEAVQAAIRFAFEDMGLLGLKAVTRPDNQASQRVLLRCGFSLQPGAEPEGGLLWHLPRP